MRTNLFELKRIQSRMHVENGILLLKWKCLEQDWNRQSLEAFPGFRSHVIIRIFDLVYRYICMTKNLIPSSLTAKMFHKYNIKWHLLRINYCEKMEAKDQRKL